MARTRRHAGVAQLLKDWTMACRRDANVIIRSIKRTVLKGHTLRLALQPPPPQHHHHHLQQQQQESHFPAEPLGSRSFEGQVHYDEVKRLNMRLRE